MLDGEDVDEYCKNFPDSWTVPASSYSDFLDETDQIHTCVDDDFMNLFFMGFLDNCSENEDESECSLNDVMVEQCTQSNVNRKVRGENAGYDLCWDCKAMTVSGVTGCHCLCYLDDEGIDFYPEEIPERVFSKVESDVVVVAQFQDYDYYPYGYSSYGYYHHRDDHCYLDELSMVFGVCSLVNAIFSFVLFCFAMRKRVLWAQLGVAIKRTTEEARSVGAMMEMTQMTQGQGANFGGGGQQIHPLNTPNQQPMLVQLPNGQFGQIMPVQPFGGGMMMAGGQGQGQGQGQGRSSLAPTNYQPTLVPTAAVVVDDRSVKM